MIVLRVLRSLGLAFAVAVLAAIIGSIFAEELFSGLFFLIGLAGFFILLLKAE